MRGRGLTARVAAPRIESGRAPDRFPSRTAVGEAPSLRRSGRSLALGAVALILGALATPRSATANGCHVPDRPELALAVELIAPILPEIADPGAVEPPSRRFVPIPCTGDVPSAPRGDEPPRSPLDRAALGDDRAGSIGAFASTRESRLRPIHRPAGLERPPRSTAD